MPTAARVMDPYALPGALMADAHLRDRCRGAWTESGKVFAREDGSLDEAKAERAAAYRADTDQA